MIDVMKNAMKLVSSFIGNHILLNVVKNVLPK